MDIRCDSGIKFAETVGIADGLLEVKCRSNRCGYQPGTVVLHRFSLKTGKVLQTRAFRDPARGATHGTDQRSALRSA